MRKLNAMRPPLIDCTLRWLTTVAPRFVTRKSQRNSQVSDMPLLRPAQDLCTSHQVFPANQWGHNQWGQTRLKFEKRKSPPEQTQAGFPLMLID
jgi:hypothetical protein